MATPPVTPPVRHPLSVHDFHRMGEAGILGGEDLSIPVADFWS